MEGERTRGRTRKRGKRKHQEWAEYLFKICASKHDVNNTALHVQVVYINDIEKRNEYSQIGSLRTNVRT